MVEAGLVLLSWGAKGLGVLPLFPIPYYKFSFFFSHESDLRLAVGKNQNALSHSAPCQHCASQHSPRQTSDTGFEAHILKAGRRLHTLDIVSQSSPTFESRVRAEKRSTSGGHCLNGGVNSRPPAARYYAPNERRRLRSARFQCDTVALDVG